MNHRAISPPQFSIASVMLVMTLAAACLALLRISEFFGVIAILLSLPALARTLVVGRACNMTGEQLCFYDKVGLFGESLAATMLAYIIAIFAFVVSYAVLGTIGIAMFSPKFPGGAWLAAGAAVMVMSVTIGTFVYVLRRLTFPLQS